MDYTEIKTKKGERVVFCNFEELLKEFYGTDSMDSVKTHLTSNDEYIIHCPFCKKEGHSKHKLYIKGDLSVGHCFVCTRAFINTTETLSLEVKTPTYLDNLFGHQEFHPVYLQDPNWSLDAFRYDFDDYSEIGVNYLIGRHGFMKELYKSLGFKFINDNVAMPFFYHGDLFYYQIRFTGESKIRYYFPPISNKPPYIIEREKNNRFIIVEGVFDAIAAMIMAPEYTPMAVLGSSISDYQLEFLREYNVEDIIVYMDETSISDRIAGKIRASGCLCPVHVIKSNGQDPEEKMKEILSHNGYLQWITSDKFNKSNLKVNAFRW